MQPVDAMRTLAAAPSDRARGEPEERRAVATLRRAPPEVCWDRALLLGMQSQHPAVVTDAVKAVVHRLERRTEPSAISDLMTAILDVCFWNLSGRDITRRTATKAEVATALAFERAASALIRQISDLLEARPDAFRMQRARLLSRSRAIAHLPGGSNLHSAVLRFQRSLGSADTPSAKIGRDIDRVRQFDAMVTASTNQAMLLSILRYDETRSILAIDASWLGAYRTMIAVQETARARQAMGHALRNLVRWLDELPVTDTAREDVLPDLAATAGLATAPWDGLERRVVRHFEAHMELLPGPDHAHDLLVQMRTRFSSATHQDLLALGFRVLKRLPMVRYRSAELEEFLRAAVGEERSFDTWLAAIELVEHLATGLDDFVLTREALTAKERRRTRALEALLSHDRRLRALLYELATDPRWRISEDPTVSDQVRDAAWRALLRVRPSNVDGLIREGLFEHDGRLFIATVEQTAQAHERALWEAVLPRFEEIERDLDASRRATRLTALAKAFERTRNFEALRAEPGALGPMLDLVFEENDGGEPTEVANQAEKSVSAAGYQLEISRERIRRRLIRLRQALTTSNDRVMALEAELTALSNEASQRRLDRVDHALRVQELLQERDVAITRSMTLTADVIARCVQARRELRAQLAEAANAERELSQLQDAMDRHCDHMQQLAAQVESLVARQKTLCDEAAALRREAASAMRSAAANESRADSLERRRRNMTPPSRPTRTGDPDQDRAANSRYDDDLSSFHSTLNDLERQARSCRSDAAADRRRASSCETRANEADGQVRALQGTIDDLQGDVHAGEQHTVALNDRFCAQAETCLELRRAIERLIDRIDGLEAEADQRRRTLRATAQQNRALVAQAQADLETLQARLQTIARQMNRTGHALDDQKTQSQTFVQNIESDREEYDRVGDRADGESAQADATGHSLNERDRVNRLRRQEAAVLYTERIERATADKPKARRLDRRKRPQSRKKKTPEKT